jgi:hypothetical protein
MGILSLEDGLIYTTASYYTDRRHRWPQLSGAVLPCDVWHTAHCRGFVQSLGDLNDFQFSAPVATLEAAGLTDLFATLPEAERYNYVFQGNSQTLDHMLVSSGLQSALGPGSFDVVHVNAEFADQASDHDPQVARFLLPTT